MQRSGPSTIAVLAVICLSAPVGCRPRGPGAAPLLLEAAPEAPPAVPQGSPPGSIVINEIQYHAPGNDRRDEWIELLNRGQEPVDLGGWRLTGAIELAFPAATLLGAGELLVACADAARVRESFGIENVIGDWTGFLKNGRDQIRLLDASGAIADLVAYADEPPFPVLADGLGRSLERRSPAGPSSFAGNWGAAAASGWTRYRSSGVATSTVLYLYLLGRGEVHVDDISIRPLSGGANALENGDFEVGLSRWQVNGNHAASSAGAEAARSGRRGLKLSASGPGDSRVASVSSAALDLRRGETYLLELWARFPAAHVPLVARLSSGGTGTPGISLEARPAGATPGAQNSIHAPSLPPFVFPLRHAPARPRPGDAVVIEAAVTAGAAPGAGATQCSVTLYFDEGRGERSLAMHDDGDAAHGDAAAGDGIYSRKLGPFRRGTLVRYRVVAEDSEGQRGAFPFAESPTSSLGFYVDDTPPAPFPIYHLIIEPSVLADLDRNPFSDAYRKGTFIHDGQVFCDAGIRYRGQTSRFIPKRHWKVKLNKDQRFTPPLPGGRAVRNFNLNSSYGDKSFLREKLGYDLWRDLGRPTCQTQHVRMHLNGSYLGFYLHLENPGDGYLERNGLAGGWVWKAYSSGHRGAQGFELKSGEPASGTAALDEFLRDLRLLEDDALERYLEERMDVESFIDFLAASQLIHSADHIEKNYLVHLSPERKFTFLPWDLDLTHGRNFECRGGGIWNDLIRHDLWDDEYRDRRLLFGTQLHPKCDGPVNAVIDAFLRRAASFRPRYYRRLAELLAHYYHPDVLLAKIERLRGPIEAEVQMDRRRWPTYGRERDYGDAYRALTGWVRDRYAHLEGKLEALGYPVGPALNADFDGGPLAGPAPLEVRFRNLSVGPIDSFRWRFGDGAESEEREAAHVYSEPGRYDVRLEVAGPAGSHAAARRAFVVVKRAAATAVSAPAAK
jgi:hypothetical protein